MVSTLDRYFPGDEIFRSLDAGAAWDALGNEPGLCADEPDAHRARRLARLRQNSLRRVLEGPGQYLDRLLERSRMYKRPGHDRPFRRRLAPGLGAKRRRDSLFVRQWPNLDPVGGRAFERSCRFRSCEPGEVLHLRPDNGHVLRKRGRRADVQSRRQRAWNLQLQTSERGSRC